MIAGITTTPNRTEYLNNVILQLIPYVRRIYLFNDIKMSGHWANTMSMYDYVLKKAEKDEPVLTCTDDILFTKDWFNKFENIHKEFNHHTYTLFSAKPHTARLNKSILGIHKKNLYDQAVVFINQGDLIQRLNNWINNENELDKRITSKKHFDVAVQEYYISNNIEWVLVIPNLVDHIGKNSTLKHKIGSSYTFKYD
jgi:hypothetical protein